jgi:hypothetical protein
MRELPSWLALFAPLPADAVAHRQAVASAEQIAKGTDGAIAGWQSVSVNLSAPGIGHRHVLITLDASGRIISGGDYVMITNEELRDGVPFMISDHESLGGRFEDDGSFKGTRWRTRMEGAADADESTPIASTPSTPTDDEIAALRRIIDDLMSR